MTTATASATTAAPPEPAGRWRILAILATAQLLGMSLWFSASATSTQLATLWNLDAGSAALLTTAVQFGFVAGTALAAMLNIADLLPARTLLAASAVLGAMANAALLMAPGFDSALAARFATGFFLAGVYPPAMKMAATWFRSARGLAIGIVVGALTFGKALPFLINALSTVDFRFVIVSTSVGALGAAALIASSYRDGPFPFPSRPFSLRLAIAILRDRPTRLAIAGYLGHMWELYAMWALVALFTRETLLARAWSPADAALLAGLTAFAAIAAGGLGSVMAGWGADRFGRERITIVSMLLSGACALVTGWLAPAPLPLLIAVLLVWGFAIVADSAQYSALVTEVAPQHAVGTALTLQTSLGFLLTAFTIWGAASLAAHFGWGVAFSSLALGPAFGIAAMRRLQLLRQRAQ